MGTPKGNDADNNNNTTNDSNNNKRLHHEQTDGRNTEKKVFNCKKIETLTPSINDCFQQSKKERNNNKLTTRRLIEYAPASVTNQKELLKHLGLEEQDCFTSACFGNCTRVTCLNDPKRIQKASYNTD